jgi:Na+-translocating ferredoxin:NAD+ oxidoreductase RNF subunit RnfB
MAEHHPADFPPSLFIHTGRSMLESSTQVSEEIRANVLVVVLHHLTARQEDAALDHADLIHLAVLTLKNGGGVLIPPCAVQCIAVQQAQWHLTPHCASFAMQQRQ